VSAIINILVKVVWMPVYTNQLHDENWLGSNLYS
jgi:hypothetical protein